MHLYFIAHLNCMLHIVYYPEIFSRGGGAVKAFPGVWEAANIAHVHMYVSLLSEGVWGTYTLYLPRRGLQLIFYSSVILGAA